MDLHSFQDTIAAVATPPGRSGIGIVRMSGPQALTIADAVFVPANPARRPSRLASFSTAYGHVTDNGEVVDEVILTVMRAPRTYTTQDVVEINCHGGMVPLRRTLDLVLRHGARLADPGEFTKRAFVFGRIDLAQAESVLDVINARTEEAQRAALRQLRGELSARVQELRQRLLDLLANLEAAIDLADEGLELMSPGEVVACCAELRQQVQRILAGARTGKALRDGLRVAIVGRPNVGKSSLMNALLRDERVIVTPIPGTTRDVVEDVLSIRGIPVLLADTAGLRPTEDPVESAGVDRAREAMATADLVLLVLDGSEPLTEADRDLLASAPSDRTLVVVNKCDLPAAFATQALAQWHDRGVVEVSAREGTGIGDLENAIAHLVWGGESGPGESVLVTNARHVAALQRAADALRAAENAAQQNLGEEYVASDVRAALEAVGEIVGVTLPADIIHRIFEQFCIGK